MAQIRNHQIVNNNLTGATFDRNFRFYDEMEVPILKGEIRYWQSKYYQTLKDITLIDIPTPVENDLTNSPDLKPEWWFELPNFAVKRHDFESFSTNYHPISNNILNEIVFKYHCARLCDNFDSYTNFLFDITNDSNEWKALQFSDITNFVNWYNTNTSINSVYVRIYGLIKDESYRIHKMHGRNQSLGICKGSTGKYSNYYKSGCGLQSNWDNIDTFSTDVLTRVTGVIPSVNVSGAIHFTSNVNNMYKLYRTQNCPNIIRFTSTPNMKQKYNPTTDSVSNISVDEEFYPITGSNAFYYIDNLANWSFVSVQNMSDSNYLNSYSYIKTYSFENSSGEIIIIVKPVGMDEFRINYISADNITFYGLFYNSDDKPKVYKIPSSAMTNINSAESNQSVFPMMVICVIFQKKYNGK